MQDTVGFVKEVAASPSQRQQVLETSPFRGIEVFIEDEEIRMLCREVVESANRPGTDRI